MQETITGSRGGVRGDVGMFSFYWKPPRVFAAHAYNLASLFNRREARREGGGCSSAQR